MRRSYSRTADTQLLVMSYSSAELGLHASSKQIVVLMSLVMLTQLTTSSLTRGNTESAKSLT